METQFYKELEQLSIFKNVSFEAVEGILENSPRVTLEVGERLLQAGTKNHTLYLILSGKLAVQLLASNHSQIFYLNSGQTVGEMSLIDGGDISADVLAAEQSELLAVSEQSFWRLVDVSHEFSKNLLEELASRMRKSNCVIKQNVQLRNRFKRQAYVDVLTGLRNRRWLSENFEKVAGRCFRNSQPLSLILGDIDRFKDVNDTWGHLIGDEVLSEFSEIIKRSIRPSDVAIRYGGEEFVLLLPNTFLHMAVQVAERLRSLTEAYFKKKSQDKNYPAVTVSFGVSYGENSDKEFRTIIQEADDALYKAKNSGRNRVVAVNYPQ